MYLAVVSKEDTTARSVYIINWKYTRANESADCIYTVHIVIIFDILIVFYSIILRAGRRRPMTESEMKAHSEKLRELTQKVQSYLDSARRSVLNQFPRIDRSIVQIK